MSEKTSDRDLTYMKFRVLTDHDAQCLQIGDQIESRTQPGRWDTVVNVKRMNGRGGPSRSVHLDNGYVFDPSNPKDDRLRHMTIHRPLLKFRSSAFVPQTAKPDEDEGIPVKRDTTRKNRSARKKAGSRK